MVLVKKNNLLVHPQFLSFARVTLLVERSIGRRPHKQGLFVGMTWAGPATSADPLQRSTGRRALPGFLLAISKCVILLCFGFVLLDTCCFFFFRLSSCAILFFTSWRFILFHLSLAATSAPHREDNGEVLLWWKGGRGVFKCSCCCSCIFSSPRSLQWGRSVAVLWSSTLCWMWQCFLTVGGERPQ